MTTNQHPLTPPPELLQEWIDEPQYLSEDWLGKRMNMVSMNEAKFREIINKAGQYSADMELNACCEWLDDKTIINGSTALRTSRRPKPPSLKNQALQALEEAEHADHPVQLTILNTTAHVLIREALQSIPEP